MPALAHVLHQLQAAPAVSSTASWADTSLAAFGAPSRAAIQQSVASAVSEGISTPGLVGAELSVDAAMYSMDSLRTIDPDLSPVKSGMKELTDVTHVALEREEHERRRREAQVNEARISSQSQSITPWASKVPEMKSKSPTGSTRTPLMRF